MNSGILLLLTTLSCQQAPSLDAQALARLNAHRQAAGLAALSLDPQLCKGCLAHANYLALNTRNPAVKGDALYDEDPKLPGFTEEGRRTARTAFIDSHRTDPLVRIDDFFASLFYRTSLLDPELKRIGVGHAKDARRGWVVVLTVVGGKTGAAPILYPVAGQKDVPLAFLGPEFPNPIPQSRDQHAGYPITVTFPDGSAVKKVSAVLKDSTGKELPAWLSTPEKPTVPGSGRDTICLIARNPLQPRTLHTVVLSAAVDGKPWTQTWSFTTSAAADPGLDSRSSEKLDGLRPSILEKINSYRKLAGLAPVVIDPALSAACQAHAQYLVKNSDHPSTQGLGMHREDPKLPGYSDDGARAGLRSVILAGSPWQAVDRWMAMFYHRVPLLNPDVHSIGIGFSRGGRHGGYTVVDAQSGTGNTAVVLYPADKQKDVSLAYASNEEPSPVPEDKPAGYPVTVTFPAGVSVRDVTATLKDAQGKKVEVWLSTPQKPVEPRLQRNTVCLIAKQPLQAGSTYTAAVTAQLGKTAWARTWTFTTLGK